MEKNILNIYCPSCGAPAKFDIVHQIYRCQNCDGKVTVEDVKKEKDQIVKIHSKKVDKDFKLDITSCSGCGAKIVFEENEALSNCEFCGRSLVRKRYISHSGMPRYVVPFGVTKEEAAEKLLTWCEQNHAKREAKHLKEKISGLRGYYLPYEMVEGPVKCTVKKSSEVAKFEAYGYLNGEFINCSKQLDNLVLDAMEPFDLDNLQEFDFAFVAGHRVKVSDIDSKEVEARLQDEAEANYRIRMEQLWGTKAISMETKVGATVDFPVLLPVYYITDGDVKAAVNGQTGKVSVRAEKASSYLEIPWWLKGIGVLLLALGLTFLATWMGGFPLEESLALTGILGVFYLIVFVCMLQDGGSTDFGFNHYRKIYNSGEQTYRRDKGRLVLNDAVLKRRIKEPVFMQMLDGVNTPVSYTFRSLYRTLWMIGLSIVVIFFPVIIALFVNGFDFQRLALGGSAVWFLITVPVTPIYLIRFGIQWLYENPWVYIFTEDGKRKRYRKKMDISFQKVLKVIPTILALYIVPPICLLTWFATASMIAMVYLTAFGF